MFLFTGIWIIGAVKQNFINVIMFNNFVVWDYSFITKKYITS